MFWPVCASPQTGPLPNDFPSGVQRNIPQVDGAYSLSQPYFLTYFVERDDQLRLHELRVRLVALVALGHVGAAARRERARHGADEAVEVLEDQVDLDARV